MQENGILRALNFKSSWGSMPPNPPSLVGANHSFKILDAPLSSALKINEGKVRSTRFCGVHRLGKSKQNRSVKPKPVIARFTCREDRDLVWRQRYNLKGSCFKLAEDLPPAVKKIRKTILVPAMKEAKKRLDGRNKGYHYR